MFNLLKALTCFFKNGIWEDNQFGLNLFLYIKILISQIAIILLQNMWLGEHK